MFFDFGILVIPKFELCDVGKEEKEFSFLFILFLIFNYKMHKKIIIKFF